MKLPIVGEVRRKMLMIIPKCKKCKTEENVVFKHAYTDDKIGFFMAYCEKCYSVMECNFSCKVLTEEESKEIQNNISHNKP